MSINKEDFVKLGPYFGASSPEPSLRTILIDYYQKVWEFDLKKCESFADKYIEKWIRDNK